PGAVDWNDQGAVKSGLGVCAHSVAHVVRHKDQSTVVDVITEGPGQQRMNQSSDIKDSGLIDHCSVGIGYHRVPHLFVSINRNPVDVLQPYAVTLEAKSDRRHSALVSMLYSVEPLLLDGRDHLPVVDQYRGSVVEPAEWKKEISVFCNEVESSGYPNRQHCRT